MAIIRNADGSVAQFVIDDGQGNAATGHFEAMTVPNFAVGTRIGDLQFIIDDVQLKAAPEQVVSLQALRGPVN